MICSQFLGRKLNFTELVSAWKKDRAWFVRIREVMILYNKYQNLGHDVMTCFVLLALLLLEMDYYTVWGTWKKSPEDCIMFGNWVSPWAMVVSLANPFYPEAPLGYFCRCFWHEYRETPLFAWWSLQVWHMLDWDVKKEWSYKPCL